MGWRTSLTKENVLNAIREGGSELVVFDFETTGFNSRDINKYGNPCTPDVPTQLGASRCKIIIEEDKIRFEKIAGFNKYFKIDRPVPPKITEVTGITNELLAEKGEVEKDVWNYWKTFVEGVNIFVGHNAHFDEKFMDAMAQRYGETFKPDFCIDTLEMARDLIPKSDVPNYRLGTLADLYGITGDWHKADADVEMTQKILEIFVNEYLQDTEPEAKELLKPTVYRLNLWRGWKGECRIYITTSHEDFFYDVKNKNWDKQKREGNIYSIDDIDMEWLRKQAFKKASEEMGTTIITEEEFSKWRPNLVKPTVKNVKYWEFKDYKRLYVETEKHGDFYYDLKSNRWCHQSRALVKYQISDIDVEHLEKEAFAYTGTSNIEEFSEWRPS